MVSTNDIRPGQSIIVDDVIYQIMEYAHVKPGKGKAFVKTKLKNMKDGGIIEKTFRADENVEQAFIDKKQFQYLYREGDKFIFMNNETYEQISLDRNTMDENSLLFLVENTPVTIVFDGDNPLEVRIPTHMNLKVIKTDPGEKGNTAQGGTKPAKLESGITINVPLFIQENEVVRVDTRDKRYIERIK